MAAEANGGDTTRLVAYRAALDRAVAANPKDVELLLLRGVAESPDPADRGQGSPVAAVPYFERALKLVPGHFAAHHYLTHALENAGAPIGRAPACGRVREGRAVDPARPPHARARAPAGRSH